MSTEKQRLRVVTLNIWNRGGPWNKRQQLIREELARLQPDLVGLQEVMRLRAPGMTGCQAEWLAQGFDYNIAYGPAQPIADGLTMGNALLSRFPILEQQTTVLPGSEASGETRSVLQARVDSPFGPIPILVTHLNWKLHHGSFRLAQVQALSRIVKQFAPIGEGFPPILVGDFNAEPESDEIRFLKGYKSLDGQSVFFADAWHYGGDGGPGATFDRANNGYAALGHEPPRRIDYIFVRGPDRRFRGEPMRTRVAFDRPTMIGGETVWPSDHFGLYCELSTTDELKG